MERENKQTTLDQFNELINESRGHDQKESLRGIHENHISKMEQIFNEIFSKLFNGEEYIRKV
jgi:hypothetical protein